MYDIVDLTVDLIIAAEFIALLSIPLFAIRRREEYLRFRRLRARAIRRKGTIWE